MGKVVLHFSFIDQVLHFSKLGKSEEASVYRNKEDLPFHCMLPPENHLKRKAQSSGEHRYIGVGIMMLRLFEDISFSRTNSNGTYRY